MSPKSKLTLTGLLILSSIVYLIAPFYNDILVNFGAAFQADHFGSFPTNVYHSWDLRGIGNKLIYYVVKEITILFAPPTNTFLFGLISKSIYACLFFGVSFLCINSLKPWCEKYNINPNYLKLGLVVSLVSAPSLFMQAELTAIALMLGMFALAFSSKKSLNYLSGIMLILLFSLKGITVLYGAFVLLGLLYVYKEKPELLYRAIISGALFCVGGILFYIYVIPLELLDLKNATIYQDSFSRTLYHFIGRILIRTPEHYLYGMLHIPILISGLVLGIVTLKKKVTNTRKISATTFFILGLIAIPYIYVFLQNKFFNYHYTIFIVPCVLLLARANSIPQFIGVLLIGLVSTNITIGAISHDSLLNQYQRQTNYIEDGKDIKAIIGDASPVLYLHDGTINFILHNKSYIREFYPLPIQRGQSYWRVKAAPNYKEAISRVAQFDGDYIVVKYMWFKPELHGLQEMIDTQFTEVPLPNEKRTRLYKRNTKS